jgi:hypothetical protein
MNRLILLSITLGVIFSAQAKAQITVSNTFNPPPGTVLQTRTDGLADSALFAFVNSGAGGPMNWDFSNRTYGGNHSVMVVSTSSTPSIDSFPDGNLVYQAITGTDTSWIIQRSDASVYTEIGSVNHAPTGVTFIVYRNIAPDYVFPIAYNGQWTAHHQWTEFNPPNRTDILDTTFNNVNGWGTVQYHTNSVPCLRIMSHERTTTNVYDGSNHLLYSGVNEIFTVSFIGAGFNNLIAVTKQVAPTLTIYSSYASASFVGPTTDVSEPGALPNDFSLAQNYPNPFNPTTTIDYDLPQAADVKLQVFDIIGREVDLLVGGRQEAGHHSVIWDGADRSSGMYFYKIQAGDFSETKKMLLLK